MKVVVEPEAVVIEPDAVVIAVRRSGVGKLGDRYPSGFHYCWQR